MIGWVDETLRAMSTIEVRRAPDDEPSELDVWVDTGFTGDLVMPAEVIDQLGLSPSGVLVEGELGDGQIIALESHLCFMEWDGEVRSIELLAKSSGSPLLGAGLLHDKCLTVDYGRQVVTVE